MRTSIFLGIFIGFLGLSCDIINPEEPVPGYVVVEPFQFSANPASQGSSSSKITEVWVSSGPDFLGVFALPATVPVLKTGLQPLTFQAGIKDNGIGALPEIYPFYAPFNLEVDLQPNGTTTIRPAIQYLPETKFAFIENFEGADHIFRTLRIGGPGQAMQLSTDNPFEGQACGLVTLDSTQAIAEIATWRVFNNLNSASPFVYLEMDYKSEAPVLVGLVGYRNGGSAAGIAVYEAGFLPKETWNKIYFNLSKVIFDNRFDAYQVVIQAAIPVRNGALERKTARVWLDNVKLVHF